MEKPLVSIIIPAYNMEAYLKDAIESALAQTWPNCEIIVVNDGSKDKTEEIAKSFESRGVILINQENKGLAGARNTGIKNARGNYIALLDADDLFLPEKIEKQVEYLEGHSGCGVSYCGLYHFYEDRPKDLLSLDYNFYSGEMAKNNILYKNFINPLSVVIRKESTDKIGLFNEDFKRTEDWEYWVRLMFGGISFEYLDEPLAKYRMRPSTSLSYNAKDEVHRKALQYKVFKDLYERSSREEVLKYRLPLVLSFHRLKLLIAKMENVSPGINKLHRWIISKRLKSAS